MTKKRAFWRNYKYELISFIVNVVVAVIAFLYATQTIALGIILTIFLISTFVVIYYKTKDRVFFFYPFDDFGQDQDWAGIGTLKFVRNEKCYEITDSHIGFILPRTLGWDDYSFSLAFKITNTSFGYIVRALNLSNYVMHQIFTDHIKTHLRIDGHWIVLQEIPFDENLSMSRWYHLNVTCDKRSVRMKIEGSKNDLNIIIPSEMMIQQKEVNEKGEESGRTIRYMQNVDFDFGAVGIRNHGSERALIRNFVIEKMNGR